MKYEESFQELKHASIGMEKPKSYYLDPPPLPPEDLEPATSGSQNKNEINTMNQMNQMMMHGRGNFNLFFTGVGGWIFNAICSVFTAILTKFEQLIQTLLKSPKED